MCRSDENSMFFGKREGYQEAARKLAMIQQKIGGWEVNTLSR